MSSRELIRERDDCEPCERSVLLPDVAPVGNVFRRATGFSSRCHTLGTCPCACELRGVICFSSHASDVAGELEDRCVAGDTLMVGASDGSAAAATASAVAASAATATTAASAAAAAIWTAMAAMASAAAASTAAASATDTSVAAFSACALDT